MAHKNNKYVEVCSTATLEPFYFLNSARMMMRQMLLEDILSSKRFVSGEHTRYIMCSGSLSLIERRGRRKGKLNWPSALFVSFCPPTLSPRSFDKYCSDQTRNSPVEISLLTPQTAVSSLLVWRRWKICNRERKSWGARCLLSPCLVILAECDLVFSLYLTAGSRGSLGRRGRWIWEEGNLSTSGTTGATGGM